MECLINFDSGALPATLPKIEAELHLNYTQLGALGPSSRRVSFAVPCCALCTLL